MTTAQAPAGFRYDPFSQEAMNDPLSLYGELRDHHPVYYMPEYDTFAVSRFQDVYDVLGDTTDTFQTTEGSAPSPDRLREHFPDGMPPPPTDPIGLRAAEDVTHVLVEGWGAGGGGGGSTQRDCPYDTDWEDGGGGGGSGSYSRTIVAVTPS